MNRTRVRVIVAVAGLLLAGITLSSRHHSHQSTRSAPPQPTASTAPSTPQTTTPRPAGAAPEAAPDAERLLPFTDQQITAAADLATRFTAAYTTHRYDEPPQTYLNRLNPMTSAQLRPTLAQTATDPAILNQRRQRREVTTAQARAEAIRTLGPTSITLLLTTTTRTTKRPADQQTAPQQTPQETPQQIPQQSLQQDLQQETTRYAVTVTHHGDGWQVYAIELAVTGDTGDPATDEDLP